MRDAHANRQTPISVVICTADRPEAVGCAIRSVLDQAYREFEVLVVDQSRDATTEAIVAALASDDGRLRYVRLMERGLSRAYNRGVAEAKHELLAFTDDDCVVPQGWLSAISCAFAEQRDVGLLYGQVLGPVEPEARSGGGVVPTLAIPRLERLSRKEGFRVFGMGANFAARRPLVLRLGGFDQVLGGGAPLQSAQDFDFAYRVHHEGSVILLDPRVVVHHYGFRSHADWPATVRSYGLGVGGFYFKHVRAGDVYAAMLLAGILAKGVVRLAKRLVLAQPASLYWTYLRHLTIGMWRSRSYGIDRQLRLYR